jgi:Subtilase family
MTVNQTRDEREPDPWAVHFANGADGAGGFAYRPGEVITTRRALDDPEVQRVLASERVEVDADDVVLGFVRLTGLRDPLAVVEDVRLAGHPAQPNHVVFAHCGGCCPPHPATAGCGTGFAAGPVYASPVYASPVYASPVYASPVYASPVYASPVYASPVYASPVYASPVYASDRRYRRTGLRPSSARPADRVERGRPEDHLSATAVAAGVEVHVFDTGLAGGTFVSHALDAARITGDPGDPSDVPDDDGDGYLDPAAGHGTFIAGIVDQVAPGCRIELPRVLSTLGDGDEWAIGGRIAGLAGTLADAAHTVVNLSFGGFVLDRPFFLARAIRQVRRAGAVVVASVGNDATCRPTYPAAFPGVVGVGAVGPSGPAPFSNYGPWVRACAPGVDLVSTFFDRFDGRERRGPGRSDPDRFRGWAVWSGTSFAAPVVAGALARTMATNGSTAVEAVERLLDGPALLRIPHLGTVVNAM